MNTCYFDIMFNASKPEKVKTAKKIGVFSPNENGAGAHINVNGVALVKHTPNRGNAVKLIDILTHVPAQEALNAASFEFSASPKVEKPAFLESWGSFKTQTIDSPCWIKTRTPLCASPPKTVGSERLPLRGFAMFRHTILRAFVILTLLACAAPAFAEPLPPPRQADGMSLFEALKKRSSATGGDFSLAEITREELSTILWAASGLNRGAKGWTVPMARGVPPYCKIYVAAGDGTYLYDWKKHELKKISDEKIKDKIGKQSFVKKAYYILIFVSDAEILAQFNNADAARDFSHVLTGAMTQNVYLASAALRIGARYIHTINADEISRALKLPEGDTPIALMLLGK